MKSKLRSVLVSSVAAIVPMAAFYALSFLMVLLEKKTDIVNYFDLLACFGGVFFLMGILYCFIKKIVPNKLAYFFGALLCEIVNFVVSVNTGSVSIFSVGVMLWMVMYFTFSFLPILCLDAVLLIVSAIIKVVKRKNTDSSDADVEEEKKYYYPIIIAFLVAMFFGFLSIFHIGFELMILLPLPGFVYYYFKKHCKKEWIYTLVFGITSVVCWCVAVILLRSDVYNLSSSTLRVLRLAIFIVLAIDAVDVIIKKIIKNRQLHT